LALSLPHSFDRFRTFEHSDSPPKLSELAETERRRVTLQPFAVPGRSRATLSLSTYCLVRLN